jgi:chromosome segregation ATPase
MYFPTRECILLLERFVSGFPLSNNWELLIAQLAEKTSATKSLEAQVSAAVKDVSSLRAEIESYREMLKTKSTYVEHQHAEVQKMTEMAKEKENESKRTQAELLEVKIREQEVRKTSCSGERNHRRLGENGYAHMPLHHLRAHMHALYALHMLCRPS